ncbi:alpha-mannosidase 2-like isoform X2 [Corticium candelabrum]|uniref:alpha-mannosidase 2-like isoform X2 n=1 Tax=Corticium candelabrum TaxID=121492 RepID=UPI002E26589D|nr:alpha-mannosidase 2-like isoform X2 [Corticium candelabrum]
MVEDQTASSYSVLSTITTYGSQVVKIEKFRNENRKSLSQISVKNDVLSAVFSSEQGLLKSLTRLSDGVTTELNMGFVMYGTSSNRDKSGAYLFLPDGDAQPVQDRATFVRVIRGPLIQRVTSFLPRVECEVTFINSPGTAASSAM